jgi:protease PrsW
MTRLLTNLTISSIFAVSIALILIKISKKENVHAGEVWRTILIGIFAIFPASLIELTISLYTPPLKGIWQNLFHAFIIAALVEELIKFLFIKLIFYINKPESQKKAIVLAISVGLGFALLENVMYSFDSSFIVVVRGLSALPLHLITSGIMGYYLYYSSEEKKGAHIRGFSEAFIIHGIYDFLISLSSAVSFLAIPLLAAAFYRLITVFKNTNFSNQK